MKVVKFTIANGDERRKLLGILAEAGYKIWVNLSYFEGSQAKKKIYAVCVEVLEKDIS